MSTMPARMIRSRQIRSRKASAGGRYIARLRGAFSPEPFTPIPVSIQREPEGWSSLANRVRIKVVAPTTLNFHGKTDHISAAAVADLGSAGTRPEIPPSR